MQSRLLFRESGYTIRTRSRFDGWWIVAALIALLAFYGAGWWIDHGEPLPKERGYAAGQADVVAVLQPLLDRAFDAGRADGLQSCLLPLSAAARVAQ